MGRLMGAVQLASRLSIPPGETRVDPTVGQRSTVGVFS
jgi:hypothetical protein